MKNQLLEQIRRIQTIAVWLFARFWEFASCPRNQKGKPGRISITVHPTALHPAHPRETLLEIASTKHGVREKSDQRKMTILSYCALAAIQGGRRILLSGKQINQGDLSAFLSSGCRKYKKQIKMIPFMIPLFFDDLQANKFPDKLKNDLQQGLIKMDLWAHETHYAGGVFVSGPKSPSLGVCAILEQCLGEGKQFFLIHMIPTQDELVSKLYTFPTFGLLNQSLKRDFDLTGYEFQPIQFKENR